MSFLSQDELLSMKINKMILHVVGDGNFTAENERQVEYEDFFLQRIRDIDTSPVYKFNDNSKTKTKLEEIANGKVLFQSGAQELSQAFSIAHVGSSRDGAFFIFELTCSDLNKRIYALIKYDYREVLEQNDNSSGGLLRKVVRAFIADKKAIQKSALIRVIDGKAIPELSTTDRVKPSVQISDYFEKFLDASRERSDEELNSNVKDFLINSLRECVEHLPNKNFSQAFTLAINNLRQRQEINEDIITEALLVAAGNPENEDTRVTIQNTASRNIRKFKLVGLQFKPDPKILNEPPKRRIKTTEGVTIIFPNNTNIVDVKEEHDDSCTITIKTKKVTEDTLLRDNLR
ncbi:nucleoid-associated protein [Stutzerimonas stutzeri]|uniref:nucleoid-associated protein n=1 Tax=Stutzerimonas stutzeri TaxID=316 RepID=UPI0022DDCC88|nr:nucleoid-associated protein [Stutzerimonas stutzeri]WBL59194.1 nucleoid-associated protein [Stutzerimonas stutzeri]